MNSVLEVVGGTDGANLLDVMPTVNQVESSPLVDAERAQNHVGDAAARAEQQVIIELLETGAA